MEAKKVRLFWIKLDSKFFENDGVVMIESLPGGAEMLLLIMKMMVASLDKDGVWEFSELFNGINVLANRFRTTREFITNTLNAAQACGLLQIEFENEQVRRIVIPMVRDLADSVTQGAIAKREERARKAALPDKGNEKGKEAAARIAKADVDKIVTAWNATDLPEVMRMTDKRRQKTAARVKAFGVDKVLEAIGKVGKSDFCHKIPEGKKEPWCDFDWLMKNDDNMAKALEGKYDNGPDQGFSQYMAPPVTPVNDDTIWNTILKEGIYKMATHTWNRARFEEVRPKLSPEMAAAIEAKMG